MSRKTLLRILFWALSASVPAIAADPAGWRGDGTGRFPAADPPIEWGGAARTNVLWSTPIGKAPNSSPIVAAGRAFAVAEPACLVCVDASDGKVLWRRTCGFADLEPPAPDQPVQGDAGNVIPTPAWDGSAVHVVFATGIVSSFDLAGNRRWIRRFDAKPPRFGRSASPILAGNLLVLSLGHLLAVDQATGKTAWDAPRALEGYATPVAARIGDVDVIVTSSGRVVRASDGQLLAEGLGETTYTSPLVEGDRVFFVDGTSSAFRLAIDGGRMEVRKLWEVELEGELFASPVFHQELLHATTNEGTYLVLDPATGATVLSKELDIPASSGKPGAPAAHLYPSLSLAGGRLFLFNDAGHALVLEPGKSYRELRHNRLPRGSGGTPAFGGGRIYLRSGEDLVCVGRGDS